MFDLSFTKLLVLAVLALLIFGPDQLPKVAAQATRSEQRTQRIDGERATQSHEKDSESNGRPKIVKVLLRLLCTEQEEDDRVRDKCSVFPKGSQSLYARLTDHGRGAKVSDHETGRQCGEYAG